MEKAGNLARLFRGPMLFADAFSNPDPIYLYLRPKEDCYVEQLERVLRQKALILFKTNEGTRFRPVYQAFMNAKQRLDFVAQFGEIFDISLRPFSDRNTDFKPQIVG